MGKDITSFEKRITASSSLSKGRWRVWFLLWVALSILAACTTGKEAEVSRLRARVAYDLALTELCLNRAPNEPCEPAVPRGLASIQEAIRLTPQEPLYQNTLGLVYLDLKNLPQAMEAFKKAIELNPEYAQAHHNLGVALAEAGRWEEAIKAYQKALAVTTYANPELAYSNMGWAYYNLDRLGEAENALRQALSLEPTLPAAHYHLGLVLLKAGRREEAKAAFRRALGLAPNSDSGLAAREHLKALGEEQ